MTKAKKLRPIERRFVAELTASPTIKQAAEAVGVTEQTAHRWLKKPAVQTEAGQLLDLELGQVTRRAVEAMTDALEVLVEIANDPDAPAGSRVSAARALYDGGLKLREALSLGDRVTALEAQYQELTK